MFASTFDALIRRRRVMLGPVTKTLGIDVGSCASISLADIAH